MPQNDADHSTIDLSIIIVSWNVWDLLRACLHSIEQVSRATNNVTEQVRHFGPLAAPCTLEVIVVDNASHDATPDLIPSQFPWVRLIRSTTNLGFTRGNNCGYALSQGQFVFFLNPDTEIINTKAHAQAPIGVATPSLHVDPDSLWQLFVAIRDDAAVGVVGPQLRYADNTRQDSRRRFPTPLTGFLESTWLGRMWPQNPWSRRLHLADWPATFRQDVDWLIGAAMLARRTALEAVRQPAYIGPFDEAFFMYSEELDLCRRIKQAGWRIVYVPEALVVHYEGRSSEQVVAARHIYFNTSKIHYYEKYFGGYWAGLLRRYLLLEFRLQLWQERLKQRLHHKPSLRMARIEAYRQVIQSGLNRPPQNS
ncbi:glycosyltransferase family 2 protein [soil metagenome]